MILRVAQSATKTNLGDVIVATDSDEKIRKEYDARSEKMRERYDRVIDEYRGQIDVQSKDFLITRTKVHNDIVAKLDRILESKK